MLVGRPCDCTSRNLNKTSVKEKSRGVLISANRLSFSEFFYDVFFVLNVRRLCMIVDNLISAAKVCDCVIYAWC